MNASTYTQRELLDYGTYAASLRARLVQPMYCGPWIEGQRRNAAGWTTIFYAGPGARLKPGFYVHIFGPNSNHQVTKRLGPFVTEWEAEQAAAAERP